jgi:peptide/nickel transport system substrate-binding protein
VQKIKALKQKIASIWSTEERLKLLSVIEQMGLIEKILFGVFSAVLLVSSLTLFNKASNSLSIVVPATGGVLKEGVIGYPRYVNPLLPVTDSGRDLTTLVFSGLMKTDENGKLTTDLAESYTVSEDGIKYTFILKNGITFHDGVSLTAYDVEFTINKATDGVIKSPKAPNWEGVGVKALNEKTVEFTLKKQYAPFVENLTLGILPMHIWKDIDSDAFLYSQFNFEPVGSGAYKIKEIVRNASGLPEYYHLVPFTKYAGETAYIEDVYIYFYTNEEKLVSAYKSGVINSMNSISPENIRKIVSNDSKVIKTPLPRTYAVFFNHNEAKVFADNVVREALRLATPKDKIITNVLLGFATPIESPIPKNISAIPLRNYTDDEGILKAKALLEKNGWSLDANNTLSKKDKKDITTLSFSLSTANVPELIKTAELLKEAWAQLGVKVEIKVFENSDLQQKVIIPRKYDALLFGESTGRNSDLFAFWHSSERNHPGLNIANYTSAKADKILQNLRSATDLNKKISLYLDFEKEIAKDNPVIFLFSPDLVYIVPEDLNGIVLDGITSSAERFIGINKWYMETEHIWNIPWITKINNKL